MCSRELGLTPFKTDPTATAAEIPASGSPARETEVAAIGVAREAMITNNVEEKVKGARVRASFLRTRSIYKIEGSSAPNLWELLS